MVYFKLEMDIFIQRILITVSPPYPTPPSSFPHPLPPGPHPLCLSSANTQASKEWKWSRTKQEQTNQNGTKQTNRRKSAKENL